MSHYVLGGTLNRTQSLTHQSMAFEISLTRKLRCWSTWSFQSHPHKVVVSASAVASLTVYQLAENTGSAH